MLLREVCFGSSADIPHADLGMLTRQRLGETFAKFTEGFETRDLQAAKSVLAELQAE
jgi:hypothetical protein